MVTLFKIIIIQFCGMNSMYYMYQSKLNGYQYLWLVWLNDAWSWVDGQYLFILVNHFPFKSVTGKEKCCCKHAYNSHKYLIKDFICYSQVSWFISCTLTWVEFWRHFWWCIAWWWKSQYKSAWSTSLPLCPVWPLGIQQTPKAQHTEITKNQIL